MRGRVPRRLHAGAWWLWAGGLALAAGQTNHPLVSGMIIGVASLVVAARRSGSEWAGGYRAYLVVALVVVVVRMSFRVVLGGDYGTTELVSLPRVPLPDWAGGTAVGGPITAEEALAGLYDGLRLAALLVCVGAANTLADPRRLLRSFPRALGDVATAVVVSLSLAPQLVETVSRVRRARRLRGESGGGPRNLRSLLVPVLEDTLSRSVSLAASMDTRGYGRTSAVEVTAAAPAAVVWMGLGGVTGSMFWLLSGTGSPWLPAAAGIVSLLLATTALTRRARSTIRTRYRPDIWERAEWLVAGSGLLVPFGVGLIGFLTPTSLVAGLDPLMWPVLDLWLLPVLAVAAAPAWLAPPETRVEAPSTRPIATVAS